MEQFKTDEIIGILAKEYKKLAIVAVLAIIVGAIVSSDLVIKPLYKSNAIVYPVNLSPSSEESNTEQLLQYFYSEEVKNAVAKKFDLYNHYKIDADSKQKEFLLSGMFKERVSIESTLYESIEISVKDESPELAQKITQAIIDETNALIANIRRERLQEYLTNNQLELEKNIKPLDSLKTLIVDFRQKYNIIDFGYQAKTLVKKINKGKGLSEEDSKTVDAIKTKEKDYNRITTNYDIYQGTYNYHKAEATKFKFEYVSNVSYTNVVSKPTLPDRKCYPIRTVLVTIITLSSLLMACLYIILSHYYKKQPVA